MRVWLSGDRASSRPESPADLGSVAEWSPRERAAWAAVNHLGIGAHPDDLEILAIPGILSCFDDPLQSFGGVVVSDGAGSARAGPFAEFSDQRMRETRRAEQLRAAELGRYGALVMLELASAQLKRLEDPEPTEVLRALLETARPDIVYTHSLADRHASHVAVALRVIDALRGLPRALLPRKLVGCEVWGDLDWLPAEAKQVFDVSAHQQLQHRLLEVFESQIAGGKRYDLATLGRRRAHATFSDSHRVDTSEGLVYALDLMPLVERPGLAPADYLRQLTTEFSQQLTERLTSFG